MKHTFRTWATGLITLSMTLIGCSEDTGSLGVYESQDEIIETDSSFDVLSCDTLNADVPANSTECYLGKVIDPETGKADVASFAAQFHTFENYKFPAKTAIVSDGGLLCDSIDIRLFIKNTFGDKNNPMKLAVYPLSKSKMMEESMTYYTNSDLMKDFVDAGTSPIATKVFTATDYIVSELDRKSDDYSDHVRIILDRKIGHDIMEAFYNHPEYFKDSYSFIRNVCPGFYFCTTNGSGTMLKLSVATLNLSFRYKDSAYPDSIMEGFYRFSATQEVIQTTRFENSGLSKLVNQDERYTMLKTPAGICTELTLPVKEIFKGHENDTISRASLTLNRINYKEEVNGSDYTLGAPQNVLLVRKKNMEKFFKNHQVADNQQSFTTSFESVYNSYPFNNLSRLVTYIQREKLAGMKANNQAEDEWEKANPDWNKVIIVPVTVSTTTDSYGITTQVSVNQDLSLSSAKLVRGTKENPIKMQVIYSKFAGK